VRPFWGRLVDLKRCSASSILQPFSD
jgi:hypothetical protein